ncbi:MAG: PadR family transcriptional regulator [Oscillospiraceae bacterium]|nr:PadR family transcriptional regulator [Oscillospiraceae bacterium]
MPVGRSGSMKGMEDNLKKAVTEILILSLLKQEDMYPSQITAELEKRSGNAITIVFPYAALYRMMNFGFIEEKNKKVAPDGRRRQYYAITEAGLEHLEEITALYMRFTSGVQRLVKPRKKAEKPAPAPCEP